MVGENMGFIQRIKNIFKRGVDKTNMAINGLTLANITDHPKIDIDPLEYDRLQTNINYYSNTYNKITYLDSAGTKRQRKFNTLNVTKTAARRIASIVFNEKCKVAINPIDEDSSETFKDANEFLEKVLYANNFYNLFETHLEKGIALGDFAMRVYVDETGQIKISWIRADQFYPLKSNTNEVTECAIATQRIETENDRLIYYTLLEFHEWIDGEYTISNELYRSDQVGTVGSQVPLSKLEVYADLAETTTFTAMRRPTFIFFRSPGANNKSLESPLGVGLVDNSREVLDAINTTHDQFVWEIKLGQRRVVVPAEFLKTNESHPPMFDTDQNVFVGVYGAENLGVKDITTAIRTVQYKDAISHFIKEFEVQVGLSVGSMSYAENSVQQTATEVVSNNSMTYQTRSSYLTMVEKAINELVHTIFELAGYAELFPNQEAAFSIDYDSYKVAVSFDDGVFVNKDAQLEEDLKVVVAGAMPKKQFLVRNYGLSDKEAEEWLQELNGSDNETDEGDTSPDKDSGVKTSGTLLGDNPDNTIQKVSMNGAQVTALIDIVQNVAAGQLARDSAIALITSSFPFDEEKASEILGDGSFKIEPDSKSVAAPKPKAGSGE